MQLNKERLGLSIVPAYQYESDPADFNEAAKYAGRALPDTELSQ
jgi:hypothetical protein